MNPEKSPIHENNYRTAPSANNPAINASAVRRFNLKNDNVSVVHSGETDPMPAAEPQEAFADREMEENQAFNTDADRTGEKLPEAEDTASGETDSPQERPTVNEKLGKDNMQETNVRDRGIA